MSSRDQPTPPFNSPYQQALKSTSLLQSPAYPSPARSDSASEPSKYPADGLGLYNYSQPFPASGPPTSSVLYPPSPQPTEAWAHLSTTASPLISEPIVDPWTSGAYDHPVTRSPLPWVPYQASHRSSLSSTREMSIFSGDGSEHAFPQVKLEGGSEWATDEDSSPPSTVAPDRLTNTGIFSYEHSYGSSTTPRFDSAPGESYENRSPPQMPYEERPRSSQNDNGVSITPRVRRRRMKIPAEEAKYQCDICGRGFIRSYNQKSHMSTHNPHRAKEHKCPDKDCNMKFVRKTDLNRHWTSVHAKVKDWKCTRCDARFARKDTLRRHEEDGCPKRNELLNPSLLSRTRSMRMAPGSQMPYFHSPQPSMYSSTPVPSTYHCGEAAQDIFESRHHQQADGSEYNSRSPPLFQEDSFKTEMVSERV